MPHDVDVKALIRISTLQQIVVACNRATADAVIGSPLLTRAQDGATEASKGATTDG